VKYLPTVSSFFNNVFKWIGAALVVFLLLNALALVLLPLLPSRNRDVASSLANDPSSISKELYQDMPKDYLEDVLTDLITYFQVGLSYFPHSEYCETPFRSKTFNIKTDPTGMTYRASISDCFVQPDSYSKRIYVFGGSTSVGIFVGDKETWPSQLQKILSTPTTKLEVVNYAVMGHSITEEYMRLYDLLKLGHRPSMVVVMDGLNLGLASDQSKFSNAFYQRIKETQQGESTAAYLQRLFMHLPITKLLIQLSPTKLLKFFFFRQAGGDISNTALEFVSDSTVVHYQTNRFKSGISDFKSLCAKYDIPLLYFLQPNAFYNYPIDSCPACSELSNRNYKNDVGRIYEGIKTAHADVIDLNGLFARYHRRAIVDDTHYSPAFNAYLAEKVSQNIKADTLRTAFIDSRMATGAGFAFFKPEGK
jgi:lysophospholipase L1-like esterase